MLTRNELHASIKSTQDTLKHLKYSLVSAISNYRALQRDLRNYKQHLEMLESKQMNLGERNNVL